MISGHDLFDYAAEKRGGAVALPLAARMRPRTIDEILGKITYLDRANSCEGD